MGSLLPLVDKPVLDRLTADVGEESAAFLLTSLKKEIQKSGSELAAFAAGGDYQQLEVQAHALKSAARSFGALRLGEACQALEQAAKNKSDPERLLSQFEAISQETLQAFAAH